MGHDMATRLVLMPHQLIKLAEKADSDKDLVKLPSQQVRDIAEWWFKDQEKITYLESLFLRKDK